MRGMVVAAALVGGLALSGCDQWRGETHEAYQTPPLLADRVSRIDAALDGYVAREELAGGVLLVLRDGQTVYERAFGQRDREAQAPMTTDAIFRIASQTKAIVSVAALTLVEEGRLRLSDPVGEHLPEWKETSVAVPRAGGRGYDVAPAERPITIHDLLTHTAGVDYGYGPAAAAWAQAGIQNYYFADRTEPVSAVVARMAALPMAAQPGEAYVYGYNTDILGVVIERVTGQTLAEVLQERVFGPLGMIDTAFYVDPAKAGRFAPLYVRRDGALTRAPDGPAYDQQGAYVEGPRVAFSGGAGLTSTAADYARFLEMLRRYGEFEGVRVLSRKSVELMTANALAPDVAEPFFGPGEGFGLGVSVRTDLGRAGRYGSLGSYGWGGAYHTSYWVDPARA